MILAFLSITLWTSSAAHAAKVKLIYNHRADYIQSCPYYDLACFINLLTEVTFRTHGSFLNRQVTSQEWLSLCLLILMPRMVNDRGQHFHSRITPSIPAKPVKAHVNKLLDHTERNGFSQKSYPRKSMQETEQ